MREPTQAKPQMCGIPGCRICAGILGRGLDRLNLKRTPVFVPQDEIEPTFANAVDEYVNAVMT